MSNNSGSGDRESMGNDFMDVSNNDINSGEDERERALQIAAHIGNALLAENTRLAEANDQIRTFYQDRISVWLIFASLLSIFTSEIIFRISNTTKSSLQIVSPQSRRNMIHNSGLFKTK